MYFVIFLYLRLYAFPRCTTSPQSQNKPQWALRDRCRQVMLPPEPNKPLTLDIQRRARRLQKANTRSLEPQTAAGAANPQCLLHIHRPGCRARGLRHLSMEPRLMLRYTQEQQVFWDTSVYHTPSMQWLRGTCTFDYSGPMLLNGPWDFGSRFSFVIVCTIFGSILTLALFKAKLQEYQ